MMKIQESETFFDRVYRAVKLVPSGRVTTYGQIAALLGSPRSARAVGYALRALPEGTDVPWWRVVNKTGRLSIQNMAHPAEEQAELLRRENVVVLSENEALVVAIKKYQAAVSD